MTHGHVLKRGDASGRGCAGPRGIKGGKLENCNSIINKIYFLKSSVSRLLVPVLGPRGVVPL